MEVHCYNRGCGKKFNPRENSLDSKDCLYHPGAPFFHDAYKGWSCCNKKCTDFTEFLNIKGCTTGPHSNVKPDEPESITGKKDARELQDQLSEFHGSKPTTNAPIQARQPRPDFEKTPLITVTPTKSSTLKIPQEMNGTTSGKSGEISPGESCKNGGCKATFGSSAAEAACVHHPGVPIFHEGLKFWSCCQKRTSDFQAFLDQVGCTEGKHKWIKDNEGSANIECRYDWHQTATHVVVAIYCKNYHPDKTKVEISPVRLKTHIYFPEQAGAFNLDLELAGLISVNETSASFMGTKVEIKIKKAEPGSWAKLNFPRQNLVKEVEQEEQDIDSIDTAVDDIDLDDLEVPTRRVTLSNEASAGRTGQEIV